MTIQEHIDQYIYGTLTQCDCWDDWWGLLKNTDYIEKSEAKSIWVEWCQEYYFKHYEPRQE